MPTRAGSLLTRGAAVTAALAGGLLLLLAAGRRWFSVTATGAVPQPPVHLSGRTLEPGTAALAFVALAGAGALLAARGLLRRGVGLLLVVVGAGAATLVLRGGLLPGAAGRALTSADDTLVGSGAAHASGTPWPLLALVACALVLAAGALTVLRSARWDTLGARYDAPTAPARAAEETTPSSRGTWDALDRGEDPTAGR